MFLQCANPDCATPFNFRQGHLFRFPSDQSKQPGPLANVASYSFKHAWLCKQCCESYTIHYAEGEVVLSSRAAAKPPRPPAPKTEELFARSQRPEARAVRNTAARHGRRKRKLQVLLEARASMRI
jgi:hypothetical protein